MSPIIFAYYEGKHRKIADSLFNVDSIPDNCPVCHNGIQPIQRYGWCKPEERKLWVIFECPKQKCGDIFISAYEKPVKTGIPEDIYEFVGSAPWLVKKEIFPKEVVQISEKFSKIYNQAKYAEKKKLEEICGAGYRRALEFLIKDYLIKEKNKKREVIGKTRLGTCIENNIDSQNIKDCAKRAAWLGNDETHYIRKWKDKDLEDLKDLIGLTVNWIHDEYRTRRIKKDMPEEKAKPKKKASEQPI